MAWSIELVTSKQEKLLRAGQHAAFAVGSCYGASFHQLVATACCHGAPTCPARCRQRFKNAHAGCHKKGVNRVTGIACNTTDFGICGAVLLDDVGCIVVRDSIVDARDALKVVALKQLKLAAVKSDDGFPSPSLREISLLLEIEHPNVVQCREVVVGNTLQHIFMVMEYVEHELRVLLSKHSFAIAEMKCLLVQLLRGIGHLHQCWIMHRDLKTSNILLDKKGVLKICDFGLARHFGSPLRPCTQRVQSLWYRAPELLLGQRTYSSAIDIWSSGCVFGELFLRRPLFEGKAELHQLGLIFGLAGLPSEETWPGCEKMPNWKLAESFKHIPPGWASLAEHEGLSALGLDLLQSLLQLCPERRFSAEVAQQHAYFAEVPQPQEPELLPTFKESNNEGRRCTPRCVLEDAMKKSS